MSNTSDRVRKIVAEALGHPDEHVVDTASLTDDLSADSLDKAEIAMETEEEFGFEVGEDDYEEWGTVGDVVRFVEGRAQ